ncbi:MAG TPA: HEAT repeat domain-containing protein [Planctomycetota bacterium]|nr:HEAT repeat domain-containing protein [Planctomycetota bacterium]HRR80804.1 HEAT repeat domain-containing protein [Planctomycetota bacterium]HRT94036.1 HEAT repeat domain-containing protein [Planctomycetota bacterium]
MRVPRGISLLCMAACVLGVGCGEKERPPDDPGVEAVLRSGAGDNRQTIQAFVKERGLEGLKKLLEKDSIRARIVGITGLGMLRGNREATELLLKHANGQDTEEAYWAIIALAYQGAPEAKDLIQKFMQSEEARLREGACVAIQEYRDETLYPLLDAALSDPNPAVQGVAQMMKQIIRDGQAVKHPKGD